MAVGNCCLCEKQLHPQSRYVRCSGECLLCYCLPCLKVPPSETKEWRALNKGWSCSSCDNPQGLSESIKSSAICDFCDKQSLPKTKQICCVGACSKHFCSDCAKLSASAFKVLKDQDLPWRCNACLVKPDTALNSEVDTHPLPPQPPHTNSNSSLTICTSCKITEIESTSHSCFLCMRINDLELKLSAALSKIDFLENRLLPDYHSGSPPTYSNMLKKGIATDNTAELISKLRSEEKKQSNLASNIIISGLYPTSTDPHNESLQELCKVLDLSVKDISKAEIIGSSEKLRIQLKDKCLATRALTNRSHLKAHVSLSGVYVNRDLTRDEQLMEYKLRCQLREMRTKCPQRHFYIRDGIVREKKSITPKHTVIQESTNSSTSNAYQDPEKLPITQNTEAKKQVLQLAQKTTDHDHCAGKRNDDTACSSTGNGAVICDHAVIDGEGPGATTDIPTLNDRAGSDTPLNTQNDNKHN